MSGLYFPCVIKTVLLRRWITSSDLTLGKSVFFSLSGDVDIPQFLKRHGCRSTMEVKLMLLQTGFLMQKFYVFHAF